MDCLPDELLMLIFEYLTANEVISGPSRVCRRWAALSEKRVLYFKTDEDMDRLHPGLQAVLITRGLHPLQTLLNKAVQLTPRLKELSVHAAMPFTENHILTLSQLKFLRHLDIFTNSRVLDRRIADTASRLSSLVVNESVAPGLFAYLAAKGQLKSLYMYGRALYYPRNELLSLLRAKKHHLQDLTLRCTELTDAAYELIGSCCNLISLRLYSCWLMTSKGALHVTKPKKLRTLHLTGAHMVRRIALGQFLDSLPSSLQELVLSSTCFGDEHVTALSSRVPDLSILELWRCKISQYGVVLLSTTLQKLTSLDLDVELAQCYINMVTNHPTLEFLRCMPLKDDGRFNVNSIVKLNRDKLENSYIKRNSYCSNPEYIYGLKDSMDVDDSSEIIKETSLDTILLKAINKHYFNDKENTENDEIHLENSTDSLMGIRESKHTAKVLGNDETDKSFTQAHPTTYNAGNSYTEIPGSHNARESKRPVRIDASDTRYANKYFRNTGDGFRGNLFYFWTNVSDLQPMVNESILDEYSYCYSY